MHMIVHGFEHCIVENFCIFRGFRTVRESFLRKILWPRPRNNWKLAGSTAVPEQSAKGFSVKFSFCIEMRKFSP